MNTQNALDADALKAKMADVDRKISALTPEKPVAPSLKQIRGNRDVQYPDSERLRQLLQERAQLEERLLNDLTAGRNPGALGTRPKTRPYDSNFAK